MDKIAVVILNWNGCDMLRSFLPSVVRFSEVDGAVVYVADNGSTDASVAMLRREFPSVHLILLEENHGFADGYNLALKQVEAEYVVLLNSDVEVTEHWLVPLAEYMDAYPETAACQPKIRSWRNKGQFEYAGAAGGFIDRYGYPFCRGRIMGVVEEDKGQYDTVIPIFWATGAALFIRLADYREAGGLDGRFFAHMEEIDLCWRIRLSGCDVRVVPGSVVYHLGGGTLPQGNPRKTYLNFRNNLLLLHKNLPDEVRRRRLFVRRLYDTLAWAMFILKFDWKSAGAVLKAHGDFRKMRDNYKVHPTVNLLNPDTNIILDYYLRGKRKFTDL